LAKKKSKPEASEPGPPTEPVPVSSPDDRPPDQGCAAPDQERPGEEALPELTQPEAPLPGLTPPGSASPDAPLPELTQPGSPDVHEPALVPEPPAFDLVLARAPMAQVVPAATAVADEALLPLEQRLRRSEEAVAQLHALVQSLTDRLAEEPRDHLAAVTVNPAPPAPAPANPLTGAATVLQLGKGLFQTAPAGVPPRGAGSWFGLLRETVVEARAILRMFVDPRYSMSWGGRFLPIGLLAAFAFSYYWVPFTIIPVVGYWVNKAADLVLAFVLFKVLAYEARRYRATAPDLPPSLRL
jgi:hypothetical protein